MIMTWMKRILIILAALLFSAACAFGLDVLLYNNEEHTKSVYEGTPLLFEQRDAISTVNCTLEYNDAFMDCTLTVTGEDPQIYLPAGESPVSSLDLSFGQPMEYDTQIQLFWPDETGGLSEALSFVGVIPAEAEHYTISLPESTYPFLRMDMDGDALLTGIQVGYTRTETVPYSPTWGSVILYTVTLWVLSSLLLLWLAKKKRLKRFFLCLAAGLIAAVLAEAAIWYLSPESLTYRLSGNVQTLDLADAAVIGYAQDGSVFTPVSDDPQIRFSLNADMCNAVVYLAAPLPSDAYVQLYYANAEVPMGEGNSYAYYSEKGLTALIFTVPQAVYTQLRLDINSEFVLDHIAVSDQPAVTARNPVPLNSGRVLHACALAALLTAVFFFCTSCDSSKTLYRLFLNPETRLPAVDILYCVFAGVMMMHHYYVALYYEAVPSGAHVFSLWFHIFAAVSILLGRMWKDKGFWILVVFFLLKYLRVVIPMPDQWHNVRAIFYNGVYAFFGVYAVGRAIRPKYRKTFLIVFTFIWLAAYTALSAAGLYTAWTNTKIYNLAGRFIGISKTGRLELFLFEMIAGIAGAIGAVLCIFAFTLTKSKVIRALCVIAAVIQLLASALSVVRTTYLIIALGFSLLLCLTLYNHMKTPKIGNRYRLSPLRACALVAAFVVLTGVLAVAMTYVTDAYNLVRTQGGLPISRALAEGSGASDAFQFGHRDFSGTDLNAISSGRIRIWKAAFKDITSSPEYMLWGRSVVYPMVGVNAITNYHFGHCHNMMIQSMLENGIPGLLCYLAFAGYVIFHGLRLFKNKDLPMWQRTIPIVLLSILLSELVECTTHINMGHYPMTMFYLFSGLAVAFSKEADASREKLQGNQQ